MKANLKKVLHNFANVIRIYRLIWSVNHKYILSLAFSIVFNALTPFINIIIPKLILDEIVGGRELKRLIFLSLILLTANLITRTIGALMGSYQNKALDNIKIELEHMLQDRLMRMDYLYLENNEILIRREKASQILYPTQDAHMELRATINLFNGLISSIISIVGLAYIMSSVSWPMFVIISVIVIINSLLSIYIYKKNFEIWSSGVLVATNRKNGYLQNIVVDNAYAKEVRIYGLSGWICEKMKKLTLGIISIMRRTIYRQSAIIAVSNTISIVQEGGVYLYVSWQYILGNITIGSVSMYINAIMNLTVAITNVVSNLISINNAGQYNEEFLDFINMKCEYDDGSALSGKRNIREDIVRRIVFDDVWYMYPG